jgi:hypothetical protein
MGIRIPPLQAGEAKNRHKTAVKIRLLFIFTKLESITY